ncbi:MAG: tRNA (adenosine(37)-N6)-threonylcarbamoyltransferase complex dimerization subunit type 1 TsaB [Pseudomonadota bacterium]
MRPDPTILAFDTSAAHCAAALLCGGTILAEQTTAMKKGQAEALMDMLNTTLSDAHQSYDMLDAIAVGLGPGNFTGIRISVSAARGLALSLNIPAIGVTQFEVMAYDDPSDALLVCLEAPRGQIYAQRFAQGARIGAPFQLWPEDAAETVQVSLDTHVVGAQADVVAAHLGCRSYACRDLTDIPARIARIAASKAASAGAEMLARPAPLYVRPPDAAPPRQAAPTILPDPT